MAVYRLCMFVCMYAWMHGCMQECIHASTRRGPDLLVLALEEGDAELAGRWQLGTAGLALVLPVSDCKLSPYRTFTDWAVREP